MWNRKAAIEWTIDQIENKLSGIYNTIDALFYLQGQSFVNQCDEIIDVPVFSNEPLTERQQKLFINELAKHIDGITWEEYQAYKAEKEAETQAIIEARKQSEQNIMNETKENNMTATVENYDGNKGGNEIMVKENVQTLYDVYFNLFDLQGEQITIQINNKTITGILHKIEGVRNNKLEMIKLELTINYEIIVIESPSQISVEKTNNSIKYFIDNVTIEHNTQASIQNHINSANNKEHGYLQFFAAATAYDYDQIVNSLINEFLPNEREMFYILCKYLHKSQRQQVTQQTLIQFTCQVMQSKLDKSNNKYKNSFSFDLETSEAHEARKEAWKRLKTLERKGLITITDQETTFKDYIAKSKKTSFNVTRKLITLTPYGKQVAKQCFNIII
jgi:hypothetical protein